MWTVSIGETGEVNSLTCEGSVGMSDSDGVDKEDKRWGISDW